jgi:hypothetical protein
MTTKPLRLLALALLALAALGLVAVSASSCNQSPANVQIRSFQQAQKADIVCLNVNNPDGTGTPLPADMIKPLRQDECANLPNTLDAGASLPNHLIALVTQTTRGELAAVDLTAGNVVDEDPSTPAVNFIPVGPVPTDVKVEPDGQFTFVSSAAPTKPAIYAIPNARVLGASQGTNPLPPLNLADLQACALPQPPQALAVAPMTPNGGADGGATGRFVLIAMLREFAGMPPVVASIDIDQLVHEPAGSLPACHILGFTKLSGPPTTTWTPGPAWPDGVPYVDGGVDLDGQSPPLGPSCAAASAEAGAPGAPAIPLAVTQSAEPTPLHMALRDDKPVVYVADSMLPLIHVVDLTDPTAPAELQPLLATSIVNPTRAVTVGQLAVSPVTRDFKRYLYAVDQGEGSLMVYDVTDPVASPHTPMVRPHAELNPFVDPDRIAFAAPVATVAFVMHDWLLPDQTQMPNPVNQYSGLLCNPNPNAHPDAGASPGTGLFRDNGAFYRADQVSVIQTNATVDFIPGRLRGVFGFATLSNGAIVAIDVDDWDAPCRRPDPMATMPVTDLGGKTYTPNAPPGMNSSTGLGSLMGQTGSLDVPQPPPSPTTTDLDPFHAPLTYNSLINESSAVTQESFFPVSAPNRQRSSVLLLNDPLSGTHVPNVLGAPQLFNVSGSSVSSGTAAPLILATVLPQGWLDPSFVTNPAEPNPSARMASSNLVSSFLEHPADLVPGQPSPNAAADGGTTMAGMNSLSSSIRVSFDDPTAHIDQDWTVTYEGVLPSVSGITGVLSSSDGFQTMTLLAPNSQLCERGIEDAQIGRARAEQVLAALQAAGLKQSNLPTPTTAPNTSTPLPADTSLTAWTGDYIQITDDLLTSTDMYWSAPTVTASGAPNNPCWDGPLADNSAANIARKRFDTCDQVFGTSSDQSFNVNTTFTRDFPILQAFDDHLVLGRFYFPSQDASGNPVTESSTNRTIVGPNPTNAAALRFAQCCFHSQVGFAVRTGGEWVASGNSLGLLHHVQTDPSTGACVLSCDERLQLANARSFDIPWGTFSTNASNTGTCNPAVAPVPPGRDSILAFRNPMLSYVTWSGCGPATSTVDHTSTSRDLEWRFSLRGGFNPLTISLTQGTNVPVSPQSMLFIPPLGQLAVVDGQLQGLVLIDLNTLTFAHAPYF